MAGEMELVEADGPADQSFTEDLMDGEPVSPDSTNAGSAFKRGLPAAAGSPGDNS